MSSTTQSYNGIFLAEVETLHFEQWSQGAAGTGCRLRSRATIDLARSRSASPDETAESLRRKLLQPGRPFAFNRDGQPLLATSEPGDSRARPIACTVTERGGAFVVLFDVEIFQPAATKAA